jgi:hypothetical protein
MRHRHQVTNEKEKEDNEKWEARWRRATIRRLSSTGRGRKGKYKKCRWLEEKICNISSCLL